MQPTNDNPRPKDSGAVELGERLQTMRVHLEAAAVLARQGSSAAERSHDASFEQFFRRCVHDFERMELDARQLHAKLEGVGAQLAPSEQVSAASFAPGDGANDAQVTPEAARGKPGNWPAY
jgi:hypothetical protein